ncbi:MAG TPA: cupin domain-containing protein [Phenylobacterium sp.]|jgi:uncharacterized cupin superfamily protein|nr:cupin domain-containing protein [Phenylobacterium sp.]
MSKRIDIEHIEPEIGSRYPDPYNLPIRTRIRKRLGDAANLTQIGVNLITLPPGAWSSQRHWHTDLDEFTYVLSGEVVLVTEAGDETLQAGDAAGFKAGDPNGHHFQNRSGQDAVLLDMGTRSGAGFCHYSDVDMIGPPFDDPAPLTRRDGTPYQNLIRRGP